MRSDTALDYAVFQLSPKRSRCELFVSGDGKTEKLASGLLKPFASHLAVAEDQVAQEVPSIKLEVNKRTNNGTWFTKGTLERFVRFVSTPEVLELVIRIDEEMSHLEAAKKIYLQGAEDQNSSATGGDGIGASTPTDITKKELLRAIDVRLVAVRKDLTTACARASAAGFTIDTVSALQHFADRFGARRLNEACGKFTALSTKRPDLISRREDHGVDQAVQSTFDSDTSIENPRNENIPLRAECQRQTELRTRQDQNDTRCSHEQVSSSNTYLGQPSSREPSRKRDEGKEIDGAVEKKEEEALSELPKARRMARQLSVQDRISMFENKQKDTGTSNDGKIVTGKSVEVRRLSSDVSSAGQAVEKAVFRRWSGASDMSTDLNNDKKDTERSASTPYSISNSLNQTSIHPTKVNNVLRDAVASSMTKSKGPEEDSQVKDETVSQINIERISDKEVASEFRNQVGSSRHSRAFSERSEGVGSKDLISNSETEPRTYFNRSDGVGSKDRPSSQPGLTTSFRAEDVRWKSMPAENHIQSKSSMEKPYDFGLIGQAASLSQPFDMSSSNVTESNVTKDHSSQPAYFRAPSSQTEYVGSSDQTALEGHSKAAAFSKVDDAGTINDPSKVSSVSFPGRTDNSRSKHQLANFSQLRGSPIVGLGIDRKDQATRMQQPRDLMKNVGGDSRTKGHETFQEQRGSEGDHLVPQPQWHSFPGNSEDVKNKKLVFLQIQFGGLPDRGEGSSHQDMKMQPTSSSEKSHNLPGRRGETPSVRLNDDPLVSRGKAAATQEMSDFDPTVAVKQVQKLRLTKGNQELNELQIKANDLEKLFAAHRLRVPGDQSANVSKSKPAEMQVAEVGKAVYRKPMQITSPQLHRKTQIKDRTPNDPTLPTQIVGSQDSENIVDDDYSDNAKGKFYDMYVQKRDAKLKEEWSSNRMEKEAKMKAIRDYFESSSAEMKAKFSGSTRQDSVHNAKQRAERLRSFNIRSAMKITEQHPIAFLQDDEDEDVQDIREHNQYMQDTNFCETEQGDGSSRSFHSKKLLTSKTTFSSIPRSSGAFSSRSAVKPYNLNSGRRRTQRENPLAQSVPNFPDLRKENSKPLPGIGKVTTRLQPRSSRSKSIGEETLLANEEKPRSQSMRKNSTSAGEMSLSLLKSENTVLAPLKSEKEQIEHEPYNKVLMNGESKPFLRKGNGIRAGSGATIAKLKAPTASAKLNPEEEADDSEDQFEDSVVPIQRKEEELKTAMLDKFEAVVYPAHSDNEESGISKASVKSGDTELENGELLKALGSVDLDSVNEASAAIPSMLHSYEGPMHDSPSESPASWNSRGRIPFSYAQETSDIDASVESPMGSPASWSSQSLTQIEADAAQMRKKWGSTQKTTIASSASNHQTLKDVRKGFKRLLKFGRKSRGTETLADWISATTSEGDDDTEDGCDLANRSSEDLRKSRMGFSQDGFNNEELFTEQAPRSFFSLSTFRSKGSESKPR